MRRQIKKEHRKPKTAVDKGKRYRCCVCRKRSARKTTMVPYYCDQHLHLKDQTGGIQPGANDDHLHRD